MAFALAYFGEFESLLRKERGVEENNQGTKEKGFRRLHRKKRDWISGLPGRDPVEWCWPLLNVLPCYQEKSGWEKDGFDPRHYQLGKTFVCPFPPPPIPPLISYQSPCKAKLAVYGKLCFFVSVASELRSLSVAWRTRSGTKNERESEKRTPLVWYSKSRMAEKNHKRNKATITLELHVSDHRAKSAKERLLIQVISFHRRMLTWTR